MKEEMIENMSRAGFWPDENEEQCVVEADDRQDQVIQLAQPVIDRLSQDIYGLFGVDNSSKQ